MKKLLAILLVSLILAVSAKDLLMWSSFKINQAFIEKTLCINRDRPEVMCHGKCFLKKKIAENKGENNDTAPVPSPDELKQVVYFQAVLPVGFDGSFEQKQKTIFQTSTFNGQTCLEDIFQPPRALLLS